MAEQLSFDRKKGFVALPVEILDLDLSPGAFRTLVELCRMANLEGYCWPSLEQLSTRLGRSKPAISGYLKDLRAAKLISTQEQRTANGYNYRLKYRVTFWASWRQSLTGETVKKDERSVQPVKRLRESKNQSHKKHLLADDPSDLMRIVEKWGQLAKGTAYPAFSRPPSEKLIKQSLEWLETARQDEPIGSSDHSAQLSDLWHELGLRADGNSNAELVALLRQGLYSKSETEQIFRLIKQTWPKHWRQVPSPDQFKKLVHATKVQSEKRMLDLLEGYQKRWALAQKHLQPSRHAC